MNLTQLEHALTSIEVATVGIERDWWSTWRINLGSDVPDGLFKPAMTVGVPFVEAAVQSDPALASLINTLRVAPFGPSGFSLRLLATSLVGRTLAVGASRTVADLRRYISSDHFDCARVLYLAGVEVAEETTIAPGIKIVPFDRNSWLRWLIPSGNPHPDEEQSRLRKIRCAVVQTYSCERRHIPAPQQYKIDGSEVLGGFEPLEDVVSCAALIGPSAPVVVATAHGPADWIPCFLGSAGQAPIVVPESHMVRWDATSINELQRIVSSYALLSPPQRQRVAVPLRRLGLALRRNWEADTALDLGLALEVLLGAGRDSDASIGFTLRIRATRLLRHDLESRKALDRLIRDLYKLRSRAAHDGVLPTTVSGVPAQDLLTQGAALVAEVATHVILNGEPNWTDLIHS